MNDSSKLLSELIGLQPFFQGMCERHLEIVTASALMLQFEPGQQIFREGDPANRFYLILEGKVELESEEAGMIPIRTLGPGENLSWSWLFEPYYFHVSARAVEPTRAIFFYGTRLRQQCEEDHALGYEIMKRFAAAIVKSLSLLQENLIQCSKGMKQLT
jgi:CRP/FNR family transcriptional regulator, cyclic AMP receptor protein